LHNLSQLKKIIVILLILACATLGYFSYSSLQSRAFQTKNPIEIVPANAAIIIESNDIRKAWSRLAETNLVYDAALNNAYFNDFDTKLHSIDSVLNSTATTANLLDAKPMAISFHQGDGIQFFIASNGTKEDAKEVMNLLDIYGNKKQIKVKENDVFQYTIDSANYFFAHLDPFIILCSDANLINNSIAQMNDKSSLLKDEIFANLRTAKNSNLGVKVYLNGPRTGGLFSSYLSKATAEALQAKTIIPSWMALDLNEKSNALIINGLSTQDANNKFILNNKEQKPKSSKSLWLIPTDLLNYKRTAISNPSQFVKTNSIADLAYETSSCDCDPEAIFSDWIQDEIIEISFGSEKSRDNAYLIGCSGFSNLSGKLSTFGIHDAIYKSIYGTDLYEMDNHHFLKLLGINENTKEPMYYARMNDFAVFSTYNGLAKIAYQWKASQASIPNNKFINFSQKLMANYSVNDVYFSLNSFLEEAKSIIRDEYHPQLISLQTELENINGLIWQSSTAKNDLLYHSIALNTNQGNEQTGAVQKLWTLSMQKKLIGSPQVMKNHQTGTNEIVVQDENNTLHLIGATGKVKWFKNINEPIIGEITQIDIYKNGKYQMLFNTASKIHLLDINGNEVTGYPIKLSSAATNQLAVFDYEKNGDYRILVGTIDKKILNFSKDGKPVMGWSALPTHNILLNPIQHFVVDGKDYICANDISGKIYLLNRKGEIRQDVVNTINTPHKQQVYLQLGTTLTSTKFIFQDSTEKIVEMPIDGQQKSFVLDSTMYNFYQYTSDIDNDKLPEYLISFGNKFSVYGPDKTITYQELYDFDIKQNVKSIGNNHKYTIIEDQEKGQIYLFNHQFKPVQGFPQKGTSRATIGDLNKDGNLEIITIINGTQVVTYTINQLFGI
jgi:hypothetical protein